MQQAQLVWALVWALKELQVSRHSFFVFVLLSTFMHLLLECLGFTWYLISALPVLPIPQPCLFNDLPSFVTVCTPQGLAVKATCMQDYRTRISPACIGQELLPFQLSTVFLCTTWRLNPKALASLPGFCIAVPSLAVLKHGWCKASPDCCHGCPGFVPSFLPMYLSECLSVA